MARMAAAGRRIAGLQSRTFEPREVTFRQGDAGKREAYLARAGKVQVRRRAPDGSGCFGAASRTSFAESHTWQSLSSANLGVCPQRRTTERVANSHRQPAGPAAPPQLKGFTSRSFALKPSRSIAATSLSDDVFASSNSTRACAFSRLTSTFFTPGSLSKAAATEA